MPQSRRLTRSSVGILQRDGVSRCVPSGLQLFFQIFRATILKRKTIVFSDCWKVLGFLQALIIFTVTYIGPWIQPFFVSSCAISNKSQPTISPACFGIADRPDWVHDSCVFKNPLLLCRIPDLPALCPVLHLPAGGTVRGELAQKPLLQHSLQVKERVIPSNQHISLSFS